MLQLQVPAGKTWAMTPMRMAPSSRKQMHKPHQPSPALLQQQSPRDCHLHTQAAIPAPSTCPHPAALSANPAAVPAHPHSPGLSHSFLSSPFSQPFISLTLAPSCCPSRLSI